MDILNDVKIHTYSNLYFNPATIQHYWEDKDKTWYFNTWNGYELDNVINRIEPQNIDLEIISRILDFIKDIICDDNASLFKYTIDWFSHIIQHPEQNTGTHLFLYGKDEGGGKGTFQTICQKLIGETYFLKTCDTGVLTGNFNGALEDKLICIIDEGKTLGDNTSRLKDNDKIKNITTEQEQTITKKYQEAKRTKIYVNFITASNNFFTAPVNSSTDRRYVYYKISEEMVIYQTGEEQDLKNGEKAKVYFKNIRNDYNDITVMRNLFAFFKNRDISNIDITVAPITKFRQELLEHTENSRTGDTFIKMLKNGEFNYKLDTLYDINFLDKLKIQAKTPDGIIIGKNISMKKWILSTNVFNVYTEYMNTTGTNKQYWKKQIHFNTFMKENKFIQYSHQTNDRRKYTYYDLYFKNDIIEDLENTLTLGRPNTCLLKSLDEIEND